MANGEVWDPVAELKAATGTTDAPALYPDQWYTRATASAMAIVDSVLTPLDENNLPIDYSEIDAYRDAVLTVAVDIWQTRLSPAGNMQAADFSPKPYRLAGEILVHVRGLLAPYYDPNSMVG